mmetsp:Transcript_39603/g.105340  ORF Transcript_39603/g.105340 Transcript_39603/m.105340 type:complete len:232 (-) Transcript_39603:601-1296(-)
MALGRGGYSAGSRGAVADPRRGAGEEDSGLARLHPQGNDRREGVPQWDSRQRSRECHAGALCQPPKSQGCQAVESRGGGPPLLHHARLRVHQHASAGLQAVQEQRTLPSTLHDVAGGKRHQEAPVRGLVTVPTCSLAGDVESGMLRTLHEERRHGVRIHVHLHGSRGGAALLAEQVPSPLQDRPGRLPVVRRRCRVAVGLPARARDPFPAAHVSPPHRGGGLHRVADARGP